MLDAGQPGTKSDRDAGVMITNQGWVEDLWVLRSNADKVLEASFLEDRLRRSGDSRGRSRLLQPALHAEADETAEV